MVPWKSMKTFIELKHKGIEQGFSVLALLTKLMQIYPWEILAKVDLKAIENQQDLGAMFRCWERGVMMASLFLGWLMPTSVAVVSTIALSFTGKH